MNTIIEVKNLIKTQKTEWNLLKENYEGLRAVKIKNFQLDGFTLKVQFNPKRFTSTSSKVDKKSIEERECFLCAPNRPKEQKKIKWGDDFEILCNPYPIFNEHFTISHQNHLPQEIEDQFGNFLELSKSLPHWVTFYNAANCGASAPDHLHFQAGNMGMVPIENDLEALIEDYGEELINCPTLIINAVNDGLRKFFIFESPNRTIIEKALRTTYHITKTATEQEPMINMASWYQNKWIVLLFMREKHRPWQYFEEGDKNILLSPGAVDMMGTLITPLEKDFNKITLEDISDIFDQVSMNADSFEEISHQIKSKYTCV